MYRLRLHKSFDDGSYISLLQSEPQVRTLLIGDSHHTLKFPYMYFLFKYNKFLDNYYYGGIHKNGLALFFTSKPIKFLDNCNIFMSPTDYCFRVCTDHKFDGTIYKSPEELMGTIINLWWNSRHNLIEWSFIKQWEGAKDILNFNWHNYSHYGIPQDINNIRNTFHLGDCKLINRKIKLCIARKKK